MLYVGKTDKVESENCDAARPSRHQKDFHSLAWQAASAATAACKRQQAASQVERRGSQRKGFLFHDVLMIWDQDLI